jgi:hypothetical protein
MTTKYNSYSTSADLKGSFVASLTSGTAQVKTGNGYLSGITVNTSSAAIMSIYNGTSALGNVMHQSLALTTGANIDLQDERFSTGLFINITGDTEVTIRFK